ncbi:hypothetical protein LX32DRAFT_205615 [Colletotrichum zoysiae]|uniref:Uncharacterized protein n=1 Tax=Colletotrichum zoysiae TaxID=1216348 RepID=A0AAD9H645_9PEZI|nr:hypothetical protein LX32DRAFT_205615 [Colletotrichum zoysiae]
MSVGRMVVQSDQGEHEGGTSQLGSDFNASYQGSLDVRNEDSLSYHRLYTNTRSNLASQLATGNPQLPHGPESDTSGHEADPDPRAGDNTIAECADSDDSDDEADPPLSEPVNSISPVDPFHPHDERRQRMSSMRFHILSSIWKVKVPSRSLSSMESLPLSLLPTGPALLDSLRLRRT